MKFREIYELAIEIGKQADPRGIDGVNKELAAAQKEFDKLDENKKEFFDQERINNPYADTRMLAGDGDATINKMIVGIDMEVPELLLVKELNRDGAGIDLVVGHHPKGKALAALAQVMDLQPSALANIGVLKNIAEAYMDDRSREVAISTGVSNYNRTVDAAVSLDMNMMCVHTPCDNLVNKYLMDLMDEEKPYTVDDVIEILQNIPEYAAASKNNNPPMIVSGNAKRSAGKVFVDMTGGTGGPKEYFRLISDAGVSTVLCMHASKDMIDVANENKLNVIIAGHMASDSLGINLFCDQLESKGVAIVPASGFIRYSRN